MGNSVLALAVVAAIQTMDQAGADTAVPRDPTSASAPMAASPVAPSPIADPPLAASESAKPTPLGSSPTSMAPVVQTAQAAPTSRPNPVSDDAVSRTARLELSLGVMAGFLTRPSDPQYFDSTFASAGGSLSVTGFFGNPLPAQDKTALSLQPFLRRVSTWHLEASGNVSVPVPNRYGTFPNGGLRFVVNAYLHPAFALWGSVGLAVTLEKVFADYYVFESARIWIPLALGLGLRFSDTLFRLGYEISPSFSAGAQVTVFSPFGVLFAVQSVFKQQTSLSLQVRGLVGGAAGHVGVAYFFTQRHGILVAIDPSYGALTDYDDQSPARFRLGGEVGMSYWFHREPRNATGVSLSVLPRWSAPIDGPRGLGANGSPWEFQGTILLSLFSRL